MQGNYGQSLRWVLQHEGGYANLKADPGGATNKGVTQKTYDAYRRAIGAPVHDVRGIDDNEVEQIYREQYAKPVWFDRLPSGLDYALFDFAVNSGVSRAVKMLQGIVGVRQDGIMGNQTLAAVKKQDPVALSRALCDARLAFVRRLKTWKIFGRGWQRRIEQVARRACALAKDQDLPAHDALEPLTGGQKAGGEQSLAGSIASSRRSKAAVAGGAGVVLSAVPEALELAQPAKEAFAFGKYAAFIGMVITAAALAYIVWVRSRDVRD